MTPYTTTIKDLKVLLLARHSRRATEIVQLLKQGGLPSQNLVHTDRLPCRRAVEELQPDAVLFDLDLLKFEDSVSFQALLDAAGRIPLIVVLGRETSPGPAREMVRLGAEDALIWGQFDGPTLLRSIQFGIERRRSRLPSTGSDQLGLIARIAHEVLWEWDLETNLIRRDPTYLGEVFGPSFGPVVGNLEDRMRLVHPGDSKRLQQLVEEIRNKPVRDIYEAEYRVEDGTGGYLHIFDRGILLRDAQGKPVKFLGAAQNVTARKQAEERLRQSEEKFKLLFNSNPFPIWIYDAQSLRFLEVNDTALRVYGYTRQEFLALTARDIRPSQDVAAYEQEVEQLRRTGLPKERTYTHKKKDGQELLVEVHGYLFDFLGRQAVMVLAKDITYETKLRAELEEQERRRKQEISQAVVKAEEKERTAIGLELHDNVNQVLTSARLYNELAVNGEGVQALYAQKCTSLIDKAISEIRQLSHALIAPNFNRKGLLAAIREIGRLVTETRGIRVELLAQDFPEEKLDQGKKLTLFRIVQEQVNNILKHAEASLICISLSLAKSNCVRLEVADNGKGFDPQVKPKGVGLSNIRSRASFHNGRMRVCSQPGRGCRVLVSFRL
ncbi:PAS domain S-box protein [Paraflavisolibacter sp. H34]|uniref:PAS domain S-box protein n=1 Tax=Huijunlia imazamoxiresistens TaxID=3127457 RepID=UPI0030186313